MTCHRGKHLAFKSWTVWICTEGQSTDDQLGKHNQSLLSINAVWSNRLVSANLEF